MPRCELIYQDGDLALKTPYDAAFVAALHATVPRDKHSWRKPYWLIDPAYAAQVVDLVEVFYMERLAVPNGRRASAPAAETRALYINYLGRAKPRADGTAWASGYQPDDDRMRPSLVFPEDVLRMWFGQDADSYRRATPGAPQTHYATLGIPPNASPDEVKKARNRLAKQWHPDVCREPNAKTMFQSIQAAYDLLSDPQRRKRYDAGLRLQTSLHTPPSRGHRQALSAIDDDLYGYRAPLRCGMVVADVTHRLGKLHVQKILAWDDITDARGRTMVSSWAQGDDCYTVRWY